MALQDIIEQMNSGGAEAPVETRPAGQIPEPPKPPTPAAATPATTAGVSRRAPADRSACRSAGAGRAPPNWRSAK